MILTVILIIFYLQCANANYTRKANVGTVIFTEMDNLKKCWENEQIALVTSRMVFQNLLPEDNALNIENDNFFKALANYFRMTVSTVRETTSGRGKHVMLTALSDTLGGYLHHTGLPTAKYGYYMGTVSYEVVKKLYNLYEELKSFLRTDGKGWFTRSCDFTNFTVHVSPLPVMPENDKNDSCSDLIYREEKDGKITIAMPFFDTKKTPSAMALPFKSCSLWGLENKNAAHVLVKYYLTSIRCLISKNANDDMKSKFNNDFDKFLEEQVVVHLCDEKFYPAFGGVFRIRQSMGTNSGHKKVMGNYNIIAGAAETVKPKVGQAGRVTEISFIPLATTANYEFDRPTIIYIGAAVFAICWLIIGICLYCFGSRKKKDRKKDIEEETKKPSVKGSRHRSLSSNDRSVKKEISKLRSSIKSATSKVNTARVNLIYDIKSQISHSSLKKSSSSSQKSSVKKTPTEKSLRDSQQELPMFEAHSSTLTESSDSKPIVFGYDFKTSSSDSTPTESTPRSNHYKIA